MYLPKDCIPILLKQKRCSDILNDIWEHASLVILYILVTFYLLYCSFDNVLLGILYIWVCALGNIPLGYFVHCWEHIPLWKSCIWERDTLEIVLVRFSLIKMPLEKNFTNKKYITAHMSFNTDNFNEYFQPTICKYFK